MALTKRQMELRRAKDRLQLRVKIDNQAEKVKVEQAKLKAYRKELKEF